MLDGFEPAATPEERRRVTLVVVVAVLAVSSSAVIVKGIDGVQPVVIAFWRALMVGVVLLPGVRRLSGRDLAMTALAGACLAGHFATWFASLDATTVLRSTVLVALNPIWATGLEWLWTGKAPASRYWAGMALCAPGIVLMGLDLPADGVATWQGDTLALVGGMLGSVYLVLGRSVRERVGIGTYASLVALFAAGALLPVALASGMQLVGWSWWTWALIGALAAGPQLLGHNGFNYALGYLSASTVSAAILMEPVGATLLAMVFLGELPGWMSVAGGAGVVAGVLWATRPYSISNAGSTPSQPSSSGS